MGATATATTNKSAAATTPTSPLPSPRLRRSSLLALEEGATALERLVAAADDDDEELPVHMMMVSSSLSGRLGGSVRTSAASPLLRKSRPAMAGGEERVPLVAKEGEEVVAPPPALLAWIFPALLCAASYAFYNIFIKKGSYTINPILGGVVLQFVAALLGTALLAFIKVADRSLVLHYSRDGIAWSCWAGLSVGIAEMLSFCVSGMGVPATQSIPIIIGGSVLFGAVLGLLALGEVLLCMHGWVGVLLLCAGIALVATDPGDKVEEGGGAGGSSDAAPPLYVWIFPALFCAFMYATYNICIKKGSASINPILGGVILQFVAAIFGSLLLLAIVVYEGGADFLNFDGMGLLWSCCAGIAVGAAEMLSFVVSGLGYVFVVVGLLA